jgi:hypothetical protein
MNQGTQGYSLMKKTEGRKSRDTVSLSQNSIHKEDIFSLYCSIFFTEEEWLTFWDMLWSNRYASDKLQNPANQADLFCSILAQMQFELVKHSKINLCISQFTSRKIWAVKNPSLI